MSRVGNVFPKNQSLLGKALLEFSHHTLRHVGEVNGRRNLKSIGDHIDDLKELEDVCVVHGNGEQGREKDFTEYQRARGPQDENAQVTAETNIPTASIEDGKHQQPQEDTGSLHIYQSPSMTEDKPYHGYFLSLCKLRFTETDEWDAERSFTDEGHRHSPLLLPPIYDGSRNFELILRRRREEDGGVEEHTLHLPQNGGAVSDWDERRISKA